MFNNNENLKTDMPVLWREIEMHDSGILTLQNQVNSYRHLKLYNETIEKRIDTEYLNDKVEMILIIQSRINYFHGHYLDELLILVLGISFQLIIWIWAVIGVAHEINTSFGASVTAVTAASEYLNQFSKQINSGYIRKENLDQFIERSGLALNLIEKSLDKLSAIVMKFKQIPSGFEDEQILKVKFPDFIYDIIKAMEPEYRDKKIDISISCVKKFEILTYPNALSKVVVQIINNSVRHGFEHRESGNINIKIGITGRLVTFVFMDNGKGISRDNLEKNFEPFYSDGRRMTGSSLGLNIINTIIVALFRGKLKIKSREGQYTTIIFNFPVDSRN